MSNSQNLQIISRHETKASKSVREYSYHVPFDLLIDIFSRVPAKSIARFRCLSKFWASIFVRSDFSELFLTKSLNKPRFLFIITTPRKEVFVFSSPQPHNPDENSSLVATRYKSSPKPGPTGILQHICGLVFLQNRIEGKPVIYNPITGESITLPKPKVKKPADLRSFLCYDQTNKQFKVLCYQIPSYSHHCVISHWVLTLETGKSRWRKIESEPYYPYNDVTSGLCINGLLYYRNGYRCSSIVCFNVRSEKFSFININAMDMLEGHQPWIMTNYKGKLGAHLYHRDYSNKEFVLWVLEDMETHTWSKNICVLNPLWNKTVDGNMFYCTVRVTRAGEIVFSQTDPSNPFYVFFYSFEKKTFTKVEIQGLQGFGHHSSIHISTFTDYVENIKLM